MGNTCKPMAISFQCMTKFTTKKKNVYLKKKKEQGLDPTCDLPSSASAAQPKGFTVLAGSKHSALFFQALILTKLWSM